MSRGLLTVAGPTRRHGYISRINEVTHSPKTASPRCSSLAVKIRTVRPRNRARNIIQKADVSLSGLVSSVLVRIKHHVMWWMESARWISRGVFKHMSWACENTAMCVNLQCYLVRVNRGNGREVLRAIINYELRQGASFEHSPDGWAKRQWGRRVKKVCY